MTFKQKLSEDAKNIFTNTDEFAETITYTPSGGSSKTIKASIFRDRLDAGNQDRNRTLTRQAEIMIANDSTYGVTFVTRAGDYVSFPVYIGGAAVDWSVIDILSHDEGMWRLLVER